MLFVRSLQVDYPAFRHQKSEGASTFAALHPVAILFLGDAPRPCALMGEALRDERPHVRLLAIAFFEQEPADRVAREGLCERLLDGQPEVRLRAVRALSRYRATPEYARCVASLVGRLKMPLCQMQVAMCELLGRLRAPEAVVPLIGLLDKTPPIVRAAAHSALCCISGHLFGRNQSVWQNWHVGAKQSSRMAWLLSGLNQPLADARRIAHEELCLLTGRVVAFDPDTPHKAQREQHAAWVEACRTYLAKDTSHVVYSA